MGVFVEDVARDRSMDKRVCDWLSEIFRTLLVRLQLVSPLYVEASAALAQSSAHVLGHDAEMVIDTRKRP